MRSARAYFQSLCRPLLLFNSLVAVVLTLVLLRLGYDDESALARRSGCNLLLIVPPGYLGALCGIAVSQVLHCSFAWRLPRLAPRLAVPLTACGLALAAGAAALHGALGGSCPPVPALALGLLSFAAGAALFNSSSRLSHPDVIRLLAIALILGVNWVTEFLQTQPIPSTALALAGAGFLLWSCVNLATRRSAAMLPGYALAGYMRSEPAAGGWSPRTLLPAARPKRRRLRGTASKLEDWIRACLYESCGWRRGGILGLAFTFSVNAALMLAFFAFIDSFVDQSGQASDADGWFQFIHLIIYQPPAAFAEGVDLPLLIPNLFVAGMACGFTFTAPLALRSTTLYPLTRRQRARITWGAHLVQCEAIALAIAVSLGALGEACAWMGGLDARAAGLPHFLRPLLVAIFLLPAVQLFALHHHTPDALKKRRGEVTVLSVIMVTLYTVVVVALAKLWQRLEIDLHALAQLGIALAAIALVQLLYLWKLQRSFARMDLGS